MTLSSLKKLGLTAVLFGALSGAQAQDSKDVTLNVVLANTSSIVFSAGNNGQSATLSYTTPSDYLNGVTLEQATAFTASSTQAYVITVRAAGDLVYSSGGGPAGSEDIPVSNVTVQAAPSGSAPAGVTYANNVELSDSDKQILEADAGTVSQVFGLTYSTANSNKQDFIGKAEGTYTTTLTYTITAP